MERLDLDRRRDSSAIIRTAFDVWKSHLGVFAALAALPVFPVIFLVDGLWAGRIDGSDAAGSWPAEVTSGLLWPLVVGPLVTAMHVLVVLGLARGERPSVARAVAAALRVLPWVMVAVAMYFAAVTLGLILLIVPGVWLSVTCYFAAQAAVVDQAKGLAALRRSDQVVRGQWWRVLGILILLTILAYVLALPLGVVTQIVGAVTDNGPLYLLGNAITQTIVLSFTALAATLLFFDLRHRTEGVEPAPGWVVTPERPR